MSPTDCCCLPCHEIKRQTPQFKKETSQVTNIFPSPPPSNQELNSQFREPAPLHPTPVPLNFVCLVLTKKVCDVAQGQGALLGTYPGLANQFVTSHAAIRQMQETLVQEQNLFISLLGAVWRRVRPFVKRNNTSEGSRNPHREINALTCHTLYMSVDYQLFLIPKCVL